MAQNQNNGYEIQLKKSKEIIKKKILSIYLIEQERRESLIDAIWQETNLDNLLETEITLNNILKNVGELSLRLLDGDNKSLLGAFEKNLSEKINLSKTEDEDLDLDLIGMNISNINLK